MKISRTVVVTPPDCSDPRNQSEPIYEQNKNENCGKKPKSLLHEVTADDVFQKIVQTLNQPFPKVLNPARDGRNPPRCDLGKNDDAGGDDPGHQHRVCN